MTSPRPPVGREDFKRFIPLLKYGSAGYLTPRKFKFREPASVMLDNRIFHDIDTRERCICPSFKLKTYRLIAWR